MKVKLPMVSDHPSWPPPKCRPPPTPLEEARRVIKRQSEISRQLLDEAAGMIVAGRTGEAEALLNAAEQVVSATRKAVERLGEPKAT